MEVQAGISLVLIPIPDSICAPTLWPKMAVRLHPSCINGWLRGTGKRTCPSPQAHILEIVQATQTYICFLLQVMGWWWAAKETGYCSICSGWLCGKMKKRGERGLGWRRKRGGLGEEEREGVLVWGWACCVSLSLYQEHKMEEGKEVRLMGNYSFHILKILVWGRLM